jgi:type IV pilus assembly protein PilQ
MSAYPLVTPLRGRVAAAAIALVVGSASAAHGDPARNRIRAIDASETDGTTTIAIRGSATPTFTVYRLDQPARIVIDLASARLARDFAADADGATFEVNGWGVSQVSAHAVEGTRGMVRVVVRMARAGSYDVRAQGEDVLVAVTPRARPGAAAGDVAALAAAREQATRAEAAAERAQQQAAEAAREARAAKAESERTRAEAAAAHERGARDASELEQRAEQRAVEAHEAETRATVARAEAGELRAALERAHAEASSLRHERNAARAEAAQLRSERQAARAELVRATRVAAESKAALAALRAERATTAREIAKLQATSPGDRGPLLAANGPVLVPATEPAATSQREPATTRGADHTQRARAGAKVAAADGVAISDVRFRDGARVSRVAIELDGEATARIVAADARKAVLEIHGARIPSALERTLDTARFDGPVRAVSSYRDPRDPAVVRVVVDLKAPAANALGREGTTIYWDFEKSATSAAGSPTSAGGVAPSVGSSTPITAQTVTQARERKVYRGRKIDLDFKDADVHNLLRLLADVGGVNLIIPDEVRAQVTVRLRNVPWDQALEVILQSKGLWYEREGDLIRIAPRKQLDAEANAEAERRAALAQAESPEPEIFTLNYAVANQLQARVTPLLSPKGKVEVDARTNSIIINDIRSHRRRIVDLLRRLDTQTPQIQIEARIVEARSTFRHEFGIQWGGNGISSTQNGNATGLVFPSNIAIRGAADDGQTNRTGVTASPTDFAVNMPAAIGSGSGGGLGFSFGSVGGNFNVNLRLSALEDTGAIRIVSAPKITTIDNQNASISQGVSIPISVISASGVQTQFVSANLALDVRPHVSQRDCSVALQINVSKNEADFANTGARGDPSILTKQASTTILVEDGETSVIGGIYTRANSWNESKVPFFGDLPVIGALFRNSRETDDRTEVLVFITPKITNRAYLRCE